jgi:hypothetical protein
MIDSPDDTLEVDNPEEILRHEQGIFEVTSPNGHVYQVRCRPGRKMDVYDISEPQRADLPQGTLWRIRRVGGAVA